MSKSSYKHVGNDSSAPRPPDNQPARPPQQPPPIVHHGKVGANKGAGGTVPYGDKKR